MVIFHILIQVIHHLRYGDMHQLILNNIKVYKVYIELKKMIRNKECGLY
jgi:hypothetical protein